MYVKLGDDMFFLVPITAINTKGESQQIVAAKRENLINRDTYLWLTEGVAKET